MDPGSMAIIWLLLATVSLLVALGMYSWRSLRRWRASRLAWLLRAPACLGQRTLLDFAHAVVYWEHNRAVLAECLAELVLINQLSGGAAMSNETSIGSARTPYNWRLLAILVAAILVGVILVTPYSLALQGESLKMSPALLIGWVVGTAQFGIIAAIGLAVAGRIGLGLPFLESWLAGRPDWLRVRKFVLLAILTGVFVGIVIVGLDAVVFLPRMPELMQSGLGAPPVWAGFLASFYGGITEEILMRLFMLSLFAWIGRFVNRTPEGRPGMGALWVANVLAAVLFGLGH
ncbi:MAG: hypothetical protein OEW09_15215, partial [Anaerolineae bacterium]|nr:hypothetical protein [Anaerolineae bacterium]